jgi:hypothetical protein
VGFGERSEPSWKQGRIIHDHAARAELQRGRQPDCDEASTGPVPACVDPCDDLGVIVEVESVERLRWSREGRDGHDYGVDGPQYRGQLVRVCGISLDRAQLRVGRHLMPGRIANHSGDAVCLT